MLALQYSDPCDEDWVIPFLNFKRVPLHPLEAHLPFGHGAAFAGVECRERRRNEFGTARDV